MLQEHKDLMQLLSHISGGVSSSVKEMHFVQTHNKTVWKHKHKPSEAASNQRLPGPEVALNHCFYQRSLVVGTEQDRSLLYLTDEINTQPPNERRVK